MGRVFLENGKVNPLYSQGFNPDNPVGQAQEPTPQTQPMNQQSSNPLEGIGNGINNAITKGSDFLRGIGLGNIPKILGTGLSLQQLLGSRLASNYGNKQLSGQIASQPNPFMSNQQSEDIRKNPVMNVAQDTAGTLAYGIPGGGSLPVQAAKGALGLGAIEFSQPNPTVGKVAKSAAVGAVAGPVLGKLLDTSIGLVKGISGQAGREIGNIVSNTPVSETELSDIFNKLQVDAPKGVKPQDIPQAYQDVKQAINQVKVDIADGTPPLKALQNWKNTLNYTDQAKAYGAKLDKSLGNMLSQDIKSIAPEIAGPYKDFRLAARLKNVTSSIGNRLPYIIEKTIVYGTLGKILSDAYRNATKGQ